MSDKGTLARERFLSGNTAAEANAAARTKHLHLDDPVAPPEHRFSSLVSSIPPVPAPVPPTPSPAPAPAPFEFTEENFRAPSLPHNLCIHNVPLTLATDASLQGFGKIISSPDEISVENKNFEIVKWPVQGRRQLDPGTGDEAGTTERLREIARSEARLARARARSLCGAAAAAAAPPPPGSWRGAWS